MFVLFASRRSISYQRSCIVPLGSHIHTICFNFSLLGVQCHPYSRSASISQLSPWMTERIQPAASFNLPVTLYPSHPLPISHNSLCNCARTWVFRVLNLQQQSLSRTECGRDRSLLPVILNCFSHVKPPAQISITLTYMIFSD